MQLSVRLRLDSPGPLGVLASSARARVCAAQIISCQQSRGRQPSEQTSCTWRPFKHRLCVGAVTSAAEHTAQHKAEACVAGRPSPQCNSALVTAGVSWTASSSARPDRLDHASHSCFSCLRVLNTFPPGLPALLRDDVGTSRHVRYRGMPQHCDATRTIAALQLPMPGTASVLLTAAVCLGVQGLTASLCDDLHMHASNQAQIRLLNYAMMPDEHPAGSAAPECQ